MASNKENMPKKPLNSRIPVPLKPLPRLQKTTGKMDIVRKPLGALSEIDVNTAGSSSKNVRKANEKPEKISIRKINTRHVTVRQKHECLDWNFDVFKDLDEKIVISYNEDDSKETKDIQIPEDVRKLSGESKLANTPIPIDHDGVEYIKKSLKRPHSRELQGISTVVSQDENRNEKRKHQLQFNEKKHERLQSPDFQKMLYMKCQTRDYSSNIFKYLIEVEQKPLGVPKSTSTVRASFVNWIVKINGPNGNPAIIQSAVWYFDSILSIGYMPIHTRQLVAASCYWVAQKLHGPYDSAKKLVKAANNVFTSEQLLAAEREIFIILKFPVQPVVPQDFITYLSWCCDQVHPGPIEEAATFLCISGLIVDKSSCKELPSVLAASSVKNALLLTGKRDLLDRLEVCPVYQAAEKKTSSMLRVSSILRRAVKTMSSPTYEYKTLLKQYTGPPYHTAEIIMNSLIRNHHELPDFDTWLGYHYAEKKCMILKYW